MQFTGISIYAVSQKEGEKEGSQKGSLKYMTPRSFLEACLEGVSRTALGQGKRSWREFVEGLWKEMLCNLPSWRARESFVMLVLGRAGNTSLKRQNTLLSVLCACSCSAVCCLVAQLADPRQRWPRWNDLS